MFRLRHVRLSCVPAPSRSTEAFSVLGTENASRIVTSRGSGRRPAGRAAVPSSSGRVEHRHPDPGLAGDLDRALVAGVGVADDADPGIGGQYPSSRSAAGACRRRRSPGRRGSTCPCRRRRPDGWTPSSRRRRCSASAFKIGQSATASEPSSIASVSRCGRGHRAGVEVVAPDHDRRLQLARGDHLVEAQPGEVALAVAEPANPRRQALELHLLAGQPIQRAMCSWSPNSSRIASSVRVDVLGIAGQRHPAERPLALAEQRADVGGTNPG